MSNTTTNKGKKRAARERLSKFLSVLLTFAMVLQTSPVAYARWDQGDVEGYTYEEPVLAPQGEEPAPTPAPQGEEPTPVSEPQGEEPTPAPATPNEESEPEDVVAYDSSDDAETPKSEVETEVVIEEAEVIAEGKVEQVLSQVESDAPVAIKTEYTYVDDYVRVTATLDRASAIPDDAVLSVTPIYENSEYYNYDAYMDALNSHVSGEHVYDNQNTLLYDVAFLWVDPATGKTVELQPEEGAVTVRFTFRQRQLSDGIQAGSAANVEVNHLPLVDSARADTTYESTDIAATDVVVEPMGINPTSQNSLEVRTDSFSVFAFSYTVDFTYEGYTLRLGGNASITLSQILSILNIPVDLTDIASVDFSNYDLLAFERQGDDWWITSLRSFDTPETLTITLNNGDRYLIEVTDPEISPGVWDLADTDNTMYLHVSAEQSATQNEQERNAAFKLTFTYALEEDVVRAIDAYEGHPTLVYDVSQYLAESPLAIKPIKNGVISVGTRRLGTYRLGEDGKVYLDFTDTSYFDGRVSLSGYFSLTAETDATKLGDEDVWEYEFPGTGDTVVIHYKKKVQEGGKTVDMTGPDANGAYTLHYTARVNVNDSLDFMVFNDTLGGLQTLDAASVKINGAPVTVTTTESGFTFDVAAALGTESIAKGEYQVTYDTTVTKEQLEQMSSETTLETNVASWRVDGTKDVPGGSTEVEIEKPKEPIPVTKTIADGRTQRVPGEEITYNITYGNDKTELSGFEIADDMTDLQVPQGKIKITFNGQDIEIDPSAASTDDRYSTNMVTVFDYTFPEGTPGTGPVTVTYTARIIDAETAKNNGIYDTKVLSNTAEEKRQNTKSTVKPKVDFEKEPTPPSVRKVAEGTYEANNTINYTLTIGDADTAMAGVHIFDEMTDLQVLNLDSVMITVGDGNPIRLNDYVQDAIIYTDDGKYGDNIVRIFDFNMPSNAGNGPVVITYSTQIIDEDTAHANNVYGDHNIKNTGFGGKGSDGTNGIGTFGDYPIDKEVTQDGQNVNAKEVDGATVEPGSTVHYTMTFGQAGMDLAGATISDSMTYLQELVGAVTITKSDDTSFEMPHGSTGGASDGVVWDFFADEKYSKDIKLRVFNYTLPNDIGEGPITVEYDAKIITAEQAAEAGIEGKVPAFNTFTGNNHSVETEIDIKFPVTPNHDAQVRKEFDHWDVTNTMAYWNIIVEKDDLSAYPIENVTVQELTGFHTVFVSPKQGVHWYTKFKPSDFDLVNAVVTTDDGTVLTPGVDYTINKEDASFTFATLNERVHINIGVHLPNMIIDQTWMQNGVRLNNGQEATAEATYDNPRVEVIKDGAYDENARIVEWTVLINPTRAKYIDSDPVRVMFEDQIPEGLTLVNYDSPTDATQHPNIRVRYSGAVVDGYTKYYDVTVDANNKISTDIAGHNVWQEHEVGLNETRFTVSYKTKLSDEQWEQITSSASGTGYYTNHVEVTAGDEETFGAEDTVEITSDEYLNKYDTTVEDDHGVVIDPEVDINAESKNITYKVEINPHGYTLNHGQPLQLTDYISTNMDLSPESVKIVNATMGSDGKLVPAEDSPEGVEMSYNDDSRLLSIRMLPDATPLLLTYTCYARSQGVDTFSNTATLIGGGSHSSTVEEEHNVQTNDAGVKVDGIEMAMHKIDENNISKDLEGAEFQLYECELAIGELINPEQYDREYWENLLALMDRINAGGGTAAEIEEIKSNFKITNYIPYGDPVRTGELGTTPQWSSLSEHRLYAWKEVTAPENYTGNTDYHYFVGYQHLDVSTLPPHPLLDPDEQLFRKQAAWALDDACQLANDIRVASMANLTTWTATNVETEYTSIAATKVWEGDSDNLYETRPTDGIELTLYRLNADGSKEKVTSEDVSGISNPVRINVDGEGNWPTYIWNKLPSKDAEGRTLKYTVVEAKIDDYTTSYSDDGAGVPSGYITVTNKMIPKSTSITVTKAWGAGTNMPQQLKVTLKAIKTDKDGVASEPEDADFVTQYEYYLDAGNGWSHTFANIPTVLVEENESGQKVKYSLTYLVEEDPSVASKYLVTYTTEDGKTVPASGVIGGTIAIDNELQPTTSSFEAQKSFPGGKLAAGQFTFQLLRVDSESQKTLLQTKTNDANGKVAFNDVEYTNAMLEGETEKVFTYEIVEVPGEDASVAYDNTVYTITEKVRNVGGKLEVGSRQIFKTVDGFDTEVASVEFVNTKVGTLQVVKTVSGKLTAGDLTEEDKEAITFHVTGPNGYSKTFTLADMGDDLTWSDGGLVQGEYLVVETGAGKDNYTVTTTYKVDDTTSQTGRVAVEGGTTTTITVDNEYKEETGGLVVTKTFEGDEALTEAEKKQISFTVTGTNGFSQTATYMDEDHFGGAESWTLVGLAAGDYTVTEENANKDGYTLTTTYKVDGKDATAAEATLAAGSNATIELVNTYEAERGGFQVKKTVESDLATDKAEGKTFTFNVSLSDTSISGTYGEVAFFNGHATFVLSNGQTKTVTDIPVLDADGNPITYTVTEIAANGFTTTVNGQDTDTITANVVKDATPEVVFENTRQTGDLTLSKTLVSDRAADADQEFAFTVELSEPLSKTYGDMSFVDGVANVTLKAGESKVATGLPTGVSYTVTEAAATGFELTGITVGGESQTADGKATGTISVTPSTVAFENSRTTGGLDVTKTVESSTASDKNKDFTFVVTLTGLSDAAADKEYGGVQFTDGVGTFTLKNEETKSFTGLPIGIGYKVEEEAADGFVTTKTGETGSISIEKMTAAFTNSKVEGGLVVSKSVTSPVAADKTKKFDFAVELSDTTIGGTYGDMTFAAGVATFKLADGEMATATGLPEGITATVTETADGQFVTSYTGDIQGGVISSEETVAVEAVNTREAGGLQVDKTLVSDAAADASRAFHFKVTLSDDTISGVFGQMTFDGGVAEFDLKGGESAKAEGLPTGVTYTVTEDEADGFELTGITVDGKKAEKAEGAIAKDATPEVVFENTRQTGDLTLSKTLVSDRAADADQEFAFTVELSEPLSKTYGDMSFVDGVANVTLKAGESKVATGLPTGVSYTVTEAAATGFELTGITVGGESQTADGKATGTISVTPSTVAFENSRTTGGLEVSKTVVSDDDNDKTKKFDFTVTLSDTTIEGAYGDMDFAAGVATFKLADSQKATAEGLPTDITYTVEEKTEEGFRTTKTGETGSISTELATAAFTNTKADKPDFEKKIADFNDSVQVVPPITDGTIVWQDSADYDLGDDVYFRLEAKLPKDISSYKHYDLTFEDQMESTLIYNRDAEVVTDAEGCTPATIEETNNSFKVKASFGSNDADAPYLPESLAGKSVYVYFTAKLGNDEIEPVYGADGNINAARLTFTNNATSGGEGEETTDWDNVIAFTYTVDFEKVDQTGEQPVEGAVFTLYKVMSDGDKVPVKENNVGSGNKFSFKGLDDGTYVLQETTVPGGYRKADDITFTVTAEHEVELDSDGWSKTDAAIVVADPARDKVLTSLTGDRTETGQIDPNDINVNIEFKRTDTGLTASVKNDEKAEATLEVTKKFERWDILDDNATFTFELAPVTDGAPMPNEAGRIATATKSAKVATFGKIVFETPGTYEYTISEVAGDLPGVTYDTTGHTATVTVSRSDDTNTLEATVAYDGSEDALEIENTFTSLKEAFEVTKELTGRNWTNKDKFTFELAPVTEGAPMPDEAGRTATATEASGMVAKFGDIEFEKAGAYEYTITEVVPRGAQEVDDTHYLLDGVTYTVAQHTVAIDIKKAEDSNALEVYSLTYDGEESLIVTNTYAANGELNLTATKIVSGDEWPEGAKFTFRLADDKGSELGTATATVSNPIATFDAIKYENIVKDSTPKYTYTISEVVPSNAINEDGVTYAQATDEQKAAGGFMHDGVTYAHKPLVVEVTLSDNGDGTLSYNVTSAVEGEDGAVVDPTPGETEDDPVTYMVGEFENEAYAREATVEFTKAFYGNADEDITFRMTPYVNGEKVTGTTAPTIDGDNPLVYSEAQAIEWTTEVKAKDRTVVTSPAVTFYNEGTYQYLIEEADGKDGTDEATILATIVVGKDETPAVTYQISEHEGADFKDIDEPTFYNNELITLNFRSSGLRKFNSAEMITVFQPEIRKVLENGILKGGEFQFEIRDESGNLLSSQPAVNDENGRVEFEAIRYEKADTYTYTITEIAGSDDTINYSNEAITLTVTVAEADGVLTATGEYSLGGKKVEVPTITNTYKTVGIHANKYSREDLEKGIKTPLEGAHYGLWMLNPDGADVYLGVQESDAGGNLWYEIPTLEGVVYYFKEEEPPPAGHLVDPYPTDYFTLLIEDGKFSLKYFANYEEAVAYTNEHNG